MPGTRGPAILSLALLFLILYSIASPAATGAPADKWGNMDWRRYTWWRLGAHDPAFLEKIIGDVVPANGSMHSPVAEKMFWEHVVPEEWFGGFYTRLLLSRLIPGNESDAYYYKRFFRDIVSQGFHRYILGEKNATPYVDRITFLYYFTLLLDKLVPQGLYGEYYRERVIDYLAMKEIWGYNLIIAYAYLAGLGDGYYSELLDNALSRLNEINNLSNTTYRGGGAAAAQYTFFSTTSNEKLVIRLYGPGGPVYGAIISLHRCTSCEAPIATNITGADGVAVFHVPPGTYSAKLSGTAIGVIHGISVEANETSNYTVVLGRITLRILNEQGKPVSGLPIAIYGESAGIPAYHVATVMPGPGGEYTAYMPPGTYTAYLLLPGYTAELGSFTVEAGVSSNHTFIYGIVHVAITPLLDEEPTINYTVYLRITSTPDNKRYNATIKAPMGRAEAWLEPGSYVVVIENITYENGLVIKSGYVFNITVPPNKSALNTTYRLPILVYKPPALRGMERGLFYRIYHAVYADGIYAVGEYIGVIELRYGDTLPLPPGEAYYLEGIGGHDTGFLALFTDNYTYVYKGNITIATLLVQYRYRDTPVNASYRLYVDTGNGYLYLSTYRAGRPAPLFPDTRYVVEYDKRLGYIYGDVIIPQPGSLVNITLPLGRILVNITGYLEEQGLGEAIVYLMDEYGEQVYDSKLSNGTTIFYAAPGNYYVAVPYAWFGGCGAEAEVTMYNETYIEINTSSCSITRPVGEGVIVVRIHTPDNVSAILNSTLIIYNKQNYTVQASLDIYSVPAEIRINVPAGDYEVWIANNYIDGYEYYTYTVAFIDPGTEYAIDYYFPAITLNITLDDNKTAVKRAPIMITEGSGEYYYGGACYNTSDKGTITLALPPGRYTVYAAPYCSVGDTYTLYEMGSIDLSNSTTHYYKHLVYPGGEITVRVVSGNEPVPYAIVAVAEYYDGYYVWIDAVGYTDYNGTIHFAVPLGEYYVFIYTPFTYIDSYYIYSPYMEYVWLDEYMENTTIVFNVSLLYIEINSDSNEVETIHMELLDNYYYGGGEWGYDYVFLEANISRHTVLPLILGPGNYTVIMPGFDTATQELLYNYPGELYGYGENKTIILGYGEKKTVSFNLTHIVFYINASSMDGEWLVGVFPTNLSRQQGVAKRIGGVNESYPAVSFTVTPGEYIAILDGAETSDYFLPLIGDFALTLIAGHGYTWRISVDTGRPAIINMTPGLLMVRLLDVIGGAPVEHHYIYIYADNTSSIAIPRATNSNGTAYFYLSPGEYVLQISGIDYNLTINISWGDRIGYTLYMTTYIYVYLHGPDGEPVEDGRVDLASRLRNGSLTEIDYTYTYLDGLAVFPVTPGHYTVVLRGLNTIYDPYDADVWRLGQEIYGYGYAVDVDASPLGPVQVEIGLARIDVNITYRGEPVEAPVILYGFVNGTKKIAGSTLTWLGAESIYVTPGEYEVGVVGALYGRDDSVYMDIPEIFYLGLGAPIKRVNVASSNSTIYIEYNVSAIETCATLIGEGPIPYNATIYGLYNNTLYPVYSYTSFGDIQLYVTNATYIVLVYGSIGDYSFNETWSRTLTGNDELRACVGVARLHIDVNLPRQGLGANYTYSDVEIRLYSPDTGIYRILSSPNGSIDTYLPANASAIIALDGALLGNTTGYGYGLVETIYMDTSRNATINLSVIRVTVAAPGSALAGETVRLTIPGTVFREEKATGSDGSAYFIVTNGTYGYVAPGFFGAHEYYLDVSTTTPTLYNASILLSILNITHRHAPGAGTGIHVAVAEADTGSTLWLIVNDTLNITVYPGTYHVYTAWSNGWVFNETISLEPGETESVVIETGSLRAEMIDPWGRLVDEDNINITIMAGDIAVAELRMINGAIYVPVLRPGNYTLLLHGPGLAKYGYYIDNYTVAIEGGEETVFNITLSAILIRMIKPGGGGAPGFNISLATGTGGEETVFNSAETNASGYALFLVWPGNYSAILGDLGMVHGIRAIPMNYTLYMFSTEPVDLEVGEITYTPIMPDDGDTVLVTATIRNNGGHAYRGFRVDFYLNGSLVYTAWINSLLSGQETSVTAPITVFAGYDNVTIVVDEDIYLPDRDRGDNERTVIIEVLRPNLVASNITVTGDMVDGGTLNVSFTVINRGPGTVRLPFNVTVYLNDTPVYSRAIAYMARGEAFTAWFTLPAEPGYWNITLSVDPGDNITETSEDDNAATQIYYIPYPDLSIDTVEITADPLADGAPAYLVIEIANHGGETRRPFTLIVLHDNKEFFRTTLGGMPGGWRRNITLYLPLKGGTHRVDAAINPYGEVEERIRSNNNYTLTYQVPEPDITVSIQGYWPAMPGPGDTISLEVTVANTGEGATYSSFTLHVYANNTLLATRIVETPFNPGEIRSYVFTYTLPIGYYEIRVVADEENVTGDRDRGDNTASTNLRVYPADLEITMINMSAEAYNSGLPAEITIGVRNNGPRNVTRSFTVTVFIDGSLYRRLTVPGLAAGEETVLRLVYYMKPGSHIVEASIDTAGIGDINESNNARTISFYAAAPDLEVTWAGIEGSLGAWMPINISLTLANNGDGYLYNSSYIRIRIREKPYASATLAISGVMAPGADETLTATLPGLDPGTYTVEIEIGGATLWESNTSNNRYSFTINIPYPDLVVESVSLNEAPVAGFTRYNVTVTVRNNGGLFNHSFTVAIYNNASQIVAIKYVSGIMGPGDTVTLNLTVTAMPPGNLTYHAVADAMGSVVESREDNNAAAFQSRPVVAVVLYRTTYIVYKEITRNITLRIINVGAVPTNITEILVMDGNYTPLYTPPVHIEPGDAADIPVAVDAENIPEGRYVIDVYVSTGYNITFRYELTTYIVSKTMAFNATLTVDFTEASMGAVIHGFLAITSSLYATYSYTIRFYGNASAMMQTTTYTGPARTYSFALDTTRVSRSGVYTLYADVTLEKFNITKTLSITLTIHREPIVAVLTPVNGSTVSSTSLIVSWYTTTRANITVMLRRNDSDQWIRIDMGYTGPGAARIDNLEENATYVLVINASNTYGSYTTPPVFFRVKRTVAFTTHTLNITVERDYNQVFNITIKNYDPYNRHSVYAAIIYSDNDIVVNFVGTGSIDETLTLEPGETRVLHLAIHAADASRTSYKLIALLVNLDTNTSDYMEINVAVKMPVFNITIEYLGTAPYTLVQTYRITNNGDTITDLAARLEGNISRYAYIYPSVNHARLEKGESMIIHVVPDLWSMPNATVTITGSLEIYSVGLAGANKVAALSYAKSIDIAVSIPEGYHIYTVPFTTITTIGRANDWYCTNRPNVDVPIPISLDPGGDTGIHAYLMITFSPQYDRWEVRPHDGRIYLNDRLVYSWHNTIPEGTVVIDVTDILRQDLVFNPTGHPSQVMVSIRTQHMNGGHYVVSTSFQLIIEASQGRIPLVARSYEEARSVIFTAYKPPTQDITPAPEQPCGDAASLLANVKTAAFRIINRIIKELPGLEAIKATLNAIQVPPIVRSFITWMHGLLAKLWLVFYPVNPETAQTIYLAARILTLVNQSLNTLDLVRNILNMFSTDRITVPLSGIKITILSDNQIIVEFDKTIKTSKTLWRKGHVVIAPSQASDEEVIEYTNTKSLGIDNIRLRGRLAFLVTEDCSLALRDVKLSIGGDIKYKNTRYGDHTIADLVWSLAKIIAPIQPELSGALMVVAEILDVLALFFPTAFIERSVIDNNLELSLHYDLSDNDENQFIPDELVFKTNIGYNDYHMVSVGGVAVGLLWPSIKIGFETGYGEQGTVYSLSFGIKFGGAFENDWPRPVSGTIGVGIDLGYSSSSGGWIRLNWDPVNASHYMFYDDVLGYPYIALASQYSMEKPGIAEHGGRIYAAWIARGDDEEHVMYSYYNHTSGSWSEPATLPYSFDGYIVGVEPVAAARLGLVVAVEHNSYDAWNMSGTPLSHGLRMLHNITLYYTEYTGSGWTAPVKLADNVYEYSVAYGGGRAVVAWTVIDDENRSTVYATIREAGSWSPPVQVYRGREPVDEEAILGIYAGYDGESLALALWGRESMGNATIYHVYRYSDGAWTRVYTISLNATLVFTDVLFRNNTIIGVMAMGDDAYALIIDAVSGNASIHHIGPGVPGAAALMDDKLLVVTRRITGYEWITNRSRLLYGRDLGLCIYSLHGNKSVYENITRDTGIDDAYPAIYTASNGLTMLVWSRRKADLAGTPNNTLWAYGLYYLVLSNVSIESLEAPEEAVEGEPFTIALRVSSSMFNATAVLRAKLNDTVVAEKNITIHPGLNNYTLEITPPDNGSYLLRIELVDITPPSYSADIAAEETINVRRMLYVTSHKAVYGETASIRIYVDGRGPLNLTIALGNNTWSTSIYNATIGSGSHEINIDLEAVAEGWYNLTITAYRRNASDTYRWRVFIDKTPPQLDVLAPPNNTFVEGTVLIAVNATDNHGISRVAVSVNGETGEAAWNGTLYTYSIDTTSYDDGASLSITIEAYDEAGHSAASTLIIIPDNKPPHTTANATSGWYNRPLWIKLEAWDAASGVAATYYRVDDGPWIKGDTIHIPAPSSHENDGVHIIEYYSVDAMGHEEPRHVVRIGIDTRPPDAEITWPLNGSRVSGIINITGIIGDNGSGVARAWLAIGGRVYNLTTSPFNGTRPWSILLNTSQLPNGRYSAVITVVDSAGNRAADEIIVYVNNTVAVETRILIRAPGNATVYEELNVSLILVDADGEPLAVDTTAYINATIGGETRSYLVEIRRGHAWLILKPWRSGEMEIHAVSREARTGSTIFLAAENMTQVTVTARPVTLEILVPEKLYVWDTAEAVARLTDKNGTPLPGYTVRITIGGREYVAATDEYGRAVVPIKPVLPGELPVTASFTDSRDIYGSSSASATITVEKRPAPIMDIHVDYEWLNETHILLNIKGTLRDRLNNTGIDAALLLYVYKDNAWSLAAEIPVENGLVDHEVIVDPIKIRLELNDTHYQPAEITINISEEETTPPAPEPPISLLLLLAIIIAAALSRRRKT